MKTEGEMDLSECGYATTLLGGAEGKGVYSIVVSKATGNKYAVKSYGSLEAVKRFPDQDPGMRAVRELDMYFRLEHPNILHGIKFMTPRICRYIQGQFGIFLPVVDGTLHRSMTELITEERLRICHDIACAMKFLHSMDMLFPALGPNTIFITSDKRAVIGGSDEICHCIYGDGVFDPDVEPVRWLMSPAEAAEDSFSWEGDVWRVAMMIMYIMNNNFRPNIELTSKKELKNFRDKFNTEEGRRALIKHYVAGMVPRNANSALEAKIGGLLLTLVKMTDPINPISMNQVVEEMSQSLLVKRVDGRELLGQQKQVEIPQFISDVLQSAIIGLAVSSEGNQSLIVEQVLLTVDLYMRAVPYYEPLKGDTSYDEKNYTLLAGVCARLASKLVSDGMKITSSHIAELIEAATTTEIALRLNTIESSLIEMFEGVLYRRHLFHRCVVEKDLVLAYKEVVNPRYLYIDPKTWGSSAKRVIPLHTVKFAHLMRRNVGDSLVVSKKQ